MSADFNKAAQMYLIYWGTTLVAMYSVLPIPSGTSKYAYRGHRLVVLPDFQGLGIGTKIIDFFGKYYVEHGLKHFARTTHIRLRRHFDADPRWRATATNGKLRSGVNDDIDRKKIKIHFDDKRIAASYEYMGEDYANKPHKIIVVDEGDKIPTIEELRSLKENYYLIVATGNAREENECERRCKELGIRTELLYINSNGATRRNGKFSEVV